MEQQYVILFHKKTAVTYPCTELLSTNQMISDALGVSRSVSFFREPGSNQFMLSVPPDCSAFVKRNGLPVCFGDTALVHNDLLELKSHTDICYLLFVHTTDSTQVQFLTFPESGALTIGRGSDNHIILDHPAVMERHAELLPNANGITLQSAANSFTYVNGMLCSQAQLQVGDCVQILNCMMYHLGTCLCVTGAFQIKNLSVHRPSTQKNQESSSGKFTPVPRIFRSVAAEPFVIDSPPAQSQTKNIPFLLSVGPSLTMSLGMLVSVGVSIGTVVNQGISGSFITSSFMALSMLTGALLWPTLMRRYNTKQRQSYEALRTEKYTAYLGQKENEIRDIYEKNREIISNYTLPSVQRLISAFDSQIPAGFLWERNASDDDFLTVRLGSGSQDSGLRFQVADAHFSLSEDPLEDIPRQIADRYSVYEDIPISLSLLNHPIIGIYGRPSSANIMVQNIITNLIFLHSAEQVKLLFLFPDRPSALAYQHFLDIPHVWNRGKNQRYTAYTDKDADFLLTDLYNQISLPEQVSVAGTQAHYVIFAWNTAAEKSALYRYILSNPSCNLVSFVFVSDRYGHLPQDCKAVLECSKSLYGVYIKNQNDNCLIPFRPDDADQTALISSVKRLSALIADTAKDVDALPSRVSFLDLFKAANLAELNIAKRWRTSSSHHSLATPIGAAAGGEILQFDIHEAVHGCHGIVAGTTGSGKSEFLQSYILSMMVNYSPEDVNFVLIDFKGGDIATPFLGLPHLSAVISNLSSSVLYRAMVSLEAEQIRRQRLFEKLKNELNLDKIDINSYQKLFHDGVLSQPLPHLIIIMDEFAQFKTQHNEYMQKLINIAQIGRSLGIHLILATQKPAGVVDGQIWSNSRFKFCLKVLEREDSKSVLQRDEAAFLKTPGTGYMQVGYNEIFSQFQAGYCRAKYIPRSSYCNREDLTVQMIHTTGAVLAEETDVDDTIQASAKTQISEVVKELSRISKSFGFQPRPIWLPALDRFVYTDDAPPSLTADDTALLVGLLDIPTEQKQLWRQYEFSQNGNLALYGASGSGKTTLVQSLLYQGICKLTPKQFRYGVIDISSKSYAAFADTPYCLGCVSGGDSQQLEHLFRKLDQELAHRKELFSQIGCNSFSELRQHNPDRLPVLVMVLENYAKFRELAYSLEDRLIDAISSGPAYGIYFIVTTNSKSGIYYKVREQLSSAIAFHMTDCDAYREILGVKTTLVPEDIPGRGLIRYNGMAVELQTALPVHEVTEYARLQVIKQTLQNLSPVKTAAPEPTHSAAPSAPAPAAASLSPLPKSFVSAPVSPTALMIGQNTQTNIPCYLDLTCHRRILLCSEHRRDFSSCCSALFSQAHHCRIWILRGKEEGELQRIFSEIEQLAGQATRSVVLIPDFIQLYYDISDENLNTLLRYLKHHPDTVFVTCTNLNGLSVFYDTELYLELCKNASAVLFTQGQFGERNALQMNRFVQRMPPSIWQRTYAENEFLAVVEDSCTTTHFQEV